MAAVTPQNEGAVATRMLEDNTAHPVALPKVKLFPPEYKPKRIEECFSECNVLFLEETLEYSTEFVRENPHYVPSPMSVDSAVAIVLYTYDNYVDKRENIYKRVNSVLYHRRPEDLSKWCHYIWHLLHGIRCLERVSSMLYRGIDARNFKPIEYEKGRRVVWNSFSSCSMTERHAKSFMKDPAHGVFFFIDASDGRKVGGLTPFPNEDEVLLEPGSEFVVTGAVNFSDSWIVNLKQTVSRNPVIPFENISPEIFGSLNTRTHVYEAVLAWTGRQLRQTYSICMNLLEKHADFLLAHIILLMVIRDKPAIFPEEGRELLCSELLKKSTAPTNKRDCLSFLEEHANSSAGQCLLGWCYEYGTGGIGKDEKEAIRLFSLSANQNYSAAQYNLGICYQHGRGVQKDELEAVRLFTLAANQGHAQAQCNLGVCYQHGRGVQKDYAEAANKYRLAAQQGHAQAQLNLGVCYANGLGLTQNEKEAVMLFTLASQQGHISAQYNLGVFYESGRGVTKSEKEAARLFSLAAQQGHIQAQYHLGLLYSNGIGVKKDDKEAFRLFTLASQQGVVDAQFHLGVCYYNGFGVEKDDKEAVRFFQLASEQGHAQAQYYLGVCYEYGRGVSKDSKEAVQLYALAVQQEGHRSAKKPAQVSV